MAETDDLELLRARALARQRQLSMAAVPLTAPDAKMVGQAPRPPSAPPVVAPDGYVDPNTPLTPQAMPAASGVAPAYQGQVLSAQQTSPNVVEDAARSFAAGIGQGVVGLAGLPGTIRETIGGALQAVGVPETYSELASRVSLGPLFAMSPSAEDIMPMASAVTGGAINYEPQTTVGEYARTVGEFVPGGATVKAPMLYGAVPGLASEAAGQLFEGTWAETPARVVAAATAPAGAAAVTNPSGALRAVFGSGDPSQERQAAAALLERFGVPMTAGQRVGVEDMLRREMLTGPGRRIAEQQTEAFTRAVLSTIGETATRATPEVMEAAGTRIGAVFDDVQRGVDVVPDAALARRAGDIADTYNATTNVNSQSPIIRNIVTEIQAAANGGKPIPAAVLGRWRTTVSRLTRSSDGELRDAANGLRTVLDDGLEATLAAAGKTDDVARLAEARAQWRNYLALVRVTSGAGANTAEGLISPSALRSAVANQDRTAYATGNRGEIADLARAGETILRLPPNSGTPAGLAAYQIPQMASAGLGATLGGAADLGALGTGATTVAAMFAPMAYREASMLPVVQNALARQGPPLLMPGYVNALAGFAAP